VTSGAGLTPSAVDEDAVPYEAYQQLTALVKRVAEAAEAVGQRATAVRLRSGLSALGHAATRVVVAGETSTGKSRLINALLGRTGVAPVAVGETTACPITFQYGCVDVAVAHLTDAGTGVSIPTPISLSEIAFHAVADSPQPATLIEVSLTAPLLASLVLIDTPGVGGLSSGYARLNTQLLYDADALLFTYDTGAPLLAPELDFLATAAEIVASIVIAATKIDTTPRYEEVLAETRVHLATNERLAGVPLVPVSSELADRAGEHGPDRSGRLAELSGIPALADLLREFAARAVRLRWANLARRTSSVAADLAAQHRDRLAGGLTETDALDAEDARLAGLLAAEPATRITLSHLFQRLRAEPRLDFEDAASGLRSSYQASVVDGDRAALEAVPSRLEGDLAAAAAAAFADQDRLTAEMVATLSQGLDAVNVTERLAAGLGVTGVPDLDLSHAGEPIRMPGQNLLAVSGGLSIGRLAVLAAYKVGTVGPLAATLGVAAGPVGWALGGVAGLGVLAATLLRLKVMKTHQLRMHLRGWTDQTINEGRQAAARELDRRAQTIQHHIETALPDWVSDLRARRKDTAARRAAALRAPVGVPDAARTVYDDLVRLAGKADALAGRLLSGDAHGGRTKVEEIS
jgi:hypothetical protein